jgi:hypothetical protein
MDMLSVTQNGMKLFLKENFNFSSPCLFTITPVSKVSIQGVVALGGHFATLCQKLDFY